jgi:hypothetical protein
VNPSNDWQLLLRLVRSLCAIALPCLLSPRGPHVDRQAVFAGVVPRRDDKLRSICQPDVVCVAFELRACGTEVRGVNCTILFGLWDRWQPAALAQGLLSEGHTQEVGYVWRD